ncbi:hypothetical protein HMPREF3213_03330 [Heyndrickxia coagulans]|uniref:Uncharacterized protein n=1 Tax=Heyndrickxia coagulans TaxID=1398 RepID=A0A133KC32_HEYCO|nr:hypothetical protein HMPREF3213_03330 [Heyndrickxia coagulans]
MNPQPSRQNGRFCPGRVPEAAECLPQCILCRFSYTNPVTLLKGTSTKALPGDCC